MTVRERAGKKDDWLTTSQAAEELGVHRTAINAMIIDGRVPARRHGAQWRISRREFERYRSSYVRPKNVPVPHRDPEALPPIAMRVLTCLYRWDTASTAELAVVLSDHPGNIRKGLSMLGARGLAARDGTRHWYVTTAGIKLAQALHIELDN